MIQKQVTIPMPDLGPGNQLYLTLCVSDQSILATVSQGRDLEFSENKDGMVICKNGIHHSYYLCAWLESPVPVEGAIVH